MSKLKTKRSAAKRFSFTGSGRIKRNSANHRHNLGNKSRKLKRGQRQDHLVAKADEPMVRRMLPYG